MSDKETIRFLRSEGRELRLQNRLAQDVMRSYAKMVHEIFDAVDSMQKANRDFVASEKRLKSYLRGIEKSILWHDGKVRERETGLAEVAAYTQQATEERLRKLLDVESTVATKIDAFTDDLRMVIHGKDKQL